MEAGTVSMMNPVTVGKFAPWNGNWYQWRAAMEAAADLQGVGEAVQAGIDLATNPETKPNNEKGGHRYTPHLMYTHTCTYICSNDILKYVSC